MDCGFYSILDGGAANHSMAAKHQVIQTLVRDVVVTERTVEQLREELRTLSLD
jgi:hypothetical protein